MEFRLSSLFSAVHLRCNYKVMFWLCITLLLNLGFKVRHCLSSYFTPVLGLFQLAFSTEHLGCDKAIFCLCIKLLLLNLNTNLDYAFFVVIFPSQNHRGNQQGNEHHFTADFFPCLASD